MGITDTFRISGSALSAQSIHMDVIARNMANAQVISNSEQSAFKARRPEFASLMDSSLQAAAGVTGSRTAAGVRVSRFSESSAPIERKHMPESPMADEQGFVYLSNVNVIEEMAYMMQASRGYQTNLEVLNTAKQLMLRTLSLGNS
jgi:flagellar basal-body rod protein FlgC